MGIVDSSGQGPGPQKQGPGVRRRGIKKGAGGGCRAFCRVKGLHNKVGSARWRAMSAEARQAFVARGLQMTLEGRERDGPWKQPVFSDRPCARVRQQQKRLGALFEPAKAEEEARLASL